MTSFWSSFSIRRKVVVALTLTISLALAIVVALLLGYELLRQRQEKLTEIAVLANVISLRAPAVVRAGNPQGAAALLDLFASEPGVAAARLESAGGQLLAEYRRDPGRVQAVTAAHLGPAFELMSRRVVAGKSRAWLKVYYELPSWRTRLADYVLMALWVLVAALGAALLLALSLHRMIDRPLRAIAGIARKISQGRDYSLRVHTEGATETRLLAVTFNEMLDQIQARDRELERRRDSLEELVAGRTAELHRANTELQAEITERQQAEEQITRLNQELEARVERRTRDWQQQKALLDCLINSIPDPIHYKNQDGLYLGCNVAFASLVGRAPQAIPGLCDADLFAPAEVAVIREYDERLRVERQPQHFESWVTYPDGRRVLLETYKTAYAGPAGETLGVVAISRDITAQWMASDELKKKNAEQKALITSIPMIVYFKNREQHYILANQAFADQVGCSLDSIPGKTDYDFYPRPAAEHCWTVDRRVMEGGEPVLSRVEEPYVDPQGRRQWVITSKTPIRDEKGSVIGMVGTTWNITELKHAQEQARERERLLDSMFNVTGEAILVLDAAGSILAINRTAASRLGAAPPAELAGRDYFSLLPPDLARSRRAVFDQVVARGAPDTFEDERSTMMLFNSMYPVKDERGQVVQVAMFSQDITARKQAARELAQKQAQLAHSGRLSALGEMATTIAHEVGQPLQIIRTSAGIIRDEIRDGGVTVEEIAPLAEKIMGQVDRAAQIIKNVRSFARQDAGELVLGAAELRHILEDALDFFARQFTDHAIAFTLEVAEAIPDARLNPQKFQQVVVNLLSNARFAVDERAPQARPPYRKSIYIRLYPEPDRRHLVLDVEDNGTGMTPETRARCMDPFYTTKPSGEGTGLGLTILGGIVQEFGGRVVVESQPGEGTIFRIQLPAYQPGSPTPRNSLGAPPAS